MTDDERTALETERFRERSLRQHFDQHPPAMTSARYCEDCGNAIPDARRQAVPGVTMCIDCKQAEELREKVWR